MMHHSYESFYTQQGYKLIFYCYASFLFDSLHQMINFGLYVASWAKQWFSSGFNTSTLH